MDELTMVSRLRSEVPPMDHLTAAEARFRAGIADQAPAVRRGNHRPLWRVAGAGAVAAAVTAGVVTVNVGGHQQVANAAEVVLDKAAAHAGREWVTPPRPGQWVFTQIRLAKQTTSPDGRPVSAPEQDMDMWVQAAGDKFVGVLSSGGKSVEMFRNGKAVSPWIPVTMPAFPPRNYWALTRLPTAPKALIAWLHSHRALMGRATSNDNPDFATLADLLRINPIMPPKLKATIFHAMKTIPGVTLRHGVRDPNGNTDLAIVGADGVAAWNAPEDEEVLLDPTTYAYRGSRFISSRDAHGKNKDGSTWTVKAGTVFDGGFVTQTGIVDRPGQRP